MSHLAGSEAFGRALTDTLAIYLDLDQSALGPTPPDVAAAVCRILGLRVEGIAITSEKVDDIYAVASAELDRFKRNDPSGRSALMFVAYVSTFFHEARHVHDLLSTGFGVDILSAEFNYYQNALPLLGQLRNWQAQTGLPIPMPISVDHPAIQSWTLAAVRLVEGYTTLASRLERAGAPDHGIYAWMSSIHLLEASAGAVQLDIVHDLFGDEGVALFDLLVRGGASSRKYMWLINDFAELIQQRSKAREHVGRMMTFLLWTSLQGGRDDRHARGVSPVALFHAATDFVSQRADRVNSLEEIRVLLDEFCALWKLPLSAVTLTAVEERVKMLADKFTGGWRAIDAAAPDLFADIFASLNDAHLRLSTQIRSAPEVYFVGRFYSHSILEGYLPALRVDFKLLGKNYSTFTPGHPCIDPGIWDKAVLYSAILSVLLRGRCAYPIPHQEDLAFSFISDEFGLRLEDSNFIF